MDNGPRFHSKFQIFIFIIRSSACLLTDCLFFVCLNKSDAVKPQSIPPAQAPFPEQQPIHPQMSEAEFEEIMTRNRTVSSSAIARAVSDAAAGETMR